MRDISAIYYLLSFSKIDYKTAHNEDHVEQLRCVYKEHLSFMFWIDCCCVTAGVINNPNFPWKTSLWGQ